MMQIGYVFSAVTSFQYNDVDICEVLRRKMHLKIYVKL